jgi:hypothetical protein
MAYSLLPKTFDDVKSYLVTKISQKYPTLGAFLYNSFLHIFLDVIAYAIALFMDLADNLYNESHLSSAVNYENIRRIAEFYGYVAHREISANGTCVRIGMNADFDELPLYNITFSKYDPIQINGVYFLINETITLSSNPDDDSYADLPAGTYYIDVEVVQGQRISVTNSATGEQSEVFEIEDEHFENTDPIVTVNGTEYTQVDSFFTYTPTDEVYTLTNKPYMNGVNVTFGDAFRGAKLESGDSVVINYIKTDALDGQIKSIGFEVTFLDSYAYPDATPVQPYGVTFAQIIGADLKESADSIKYWGQKSISRMDNKAFNNEEVNLALHEMGGILSSKALSEYDIDPENPTEEFMNVVKLLVIPTTGGDIDDTFKQEIRVYLRDKMDFTDFIQFIDVDYVKILFELDMDVRRTASKSFATDVNSYLQTTYALESSDFGESINHSEVVANIRDEFSTDIIRFSLILKVEEDEEDLAIPTGGIISKTLQIGSFRVGSPNVLSVSIITTFMAGTNEVTETIIDDGSGSFVIGSSEFITSGTIDYETGEIELELDPNVSSISSLKYTYRCYDVDGGTDNIDIKYFQVSQYGNATINVEYI